MKKTNPLPITVNRYLCDLAQNVWSAFYANLKVSTQSAENKMLRQMEPGLKMGQDQEQEQESCSATRALNIDNKAISA